MTHGTKETSRPASDAAARQKRPLQEAVARGPLSARERDVLDARARGLSPKEIAFALRISESTVYVVLGRIRDKLRI